MTAYFRPPSVAPLAPPAPASAPDAVPSLELALFTTTPHVIDTPQVFYTEQGLKEHLKHPVLSVPAVPTVHDAPCRPKRGVKRAIGKQPTIGLDGTINK